MELCRLKWELTGLSIDVHLIIIKPVNHTNVSVDIHHHGDHYNGLILPAAQTQNSKQSWLQSENKQEFTIKDVIRYSSEDLRTFRHHGNTRKTLSRFRIWRPSVKRHSRMYSPSHVVKSPDPLTPGGTNTPHENDTKQGASSQRGFTDLLASCHISVQITQRALQNVQHDSPEHTNRYNIDNNIMIGKPHWNIPTILQTLPQTNHIKSTVTPYHQLKYDRFNCGVYRALYWNIDLICIVS